MNGRERLLTVLGGAVPDRVPVSLFVQEEFLSYLYPNREVDRVVDAVACAKHFGFDVMTRSQAFTTPYFMKKSFPGWEVKQYQRRSEGKFYQFFEIHTPDKVLRQIEAGPDTGFGLAGIHLSTTEYLLKDEADMETFLKHVPGIDPETVAEMQAYCAWSKEVIGDLGISVPWCWGGVYNQATRLRGMEQLMMDPYLDPDTYHVFMSKITDLAVDCATELALANGDALGVHGNIANAGLIGAKFFRQFILPYEKKVVEAIHAAGSFTVYHNCGKAEALLPCYTELGLTAWETVAEPPQGDNDLERAKKMVGDKLTLIGNIDQVQFLKTASAQEVKEQTEQRVAIGKPGGRYIFAGSDFLETDTPLENVAAMVEAVKAVGGY